MAAKKKTTKKSDVRGFEEKATRVDPRTYAERRKSDGSIQVTMTSTRVRLEKIDRIAKKLGISRSEAYGQLVDKARE